MYKYGKYAHKIFSREIGFKSMFKINIQVCEGGT